MLQELQGLCCKWHGFIKHDCFTELHKKKQAFILQAEMAGAPETAAILDSLNSQRADARERQAAMERQIREEARRLREGLTGPVLFCALLCFAVPAVPSCTSHLCYHHKGRPGSVALLLHC